MTWMPVARISRSVPRWFGVPVPANANAPAVTYTTGYDLVGRVLRLRQSTDAADVTYAYDTAGG